MALMLYLAVACVVWLVAIVLAFSKRTRALAKKMAAGMAGSFPGVFLFQLLSAPFLALVMLIVYAISHYSKPPDFVIIILILLIISIPTVASLFGFYSGWRVAWELAAGRSVSDFFQKHRSLGPVVRFLRKRFPFLEKMI